MPPRPSKGARSAGAATSARELLAAGAAAAAGRAAERAAFIASAADNFKINYMDSTDPTGQVWGALRPYLLQQYKIGFKSPSSAGPDIPLFNVYDFPGPIKLNVPETCTALSTAPGNNGTHWPLTTLPPRQSQRRDFASIEDFKEELNILTCGAFKHVDFKTNNAILAGGVVETCLRAPEYGSSPAEAAAAVSADGDPRGRGDADVFFHSVECWDDLVKNAAPVGAAIVRGMQETPGVATVRLERRTSTLNIIAQDAEGHAMGRPVQLILLGNTPPTASRVLHHFDLDSSQFGWEGGDQVLATFKGIRSWVFQTNIIDIEHIMASHRGGRVIYGNVNCESRIFKYWLRGYGMAVPGLTKDALRAAVATAAAATNGNDLHGLPSVLYQMRHYNAVGGGYYEEPFMLDGVGAGAAAIQAEARDIRGEHYRTRPLNPNASAEEAVFQLVTPIPSGDKPWHEMEDEPWSTEHSALALQKSWISGLEDGITAGIRPPPGYFDDQYDF